MSSLPATLTPPASRGGLFFLILLMIILLSLAPAISGSEDKCSISFETGISCQGNIKFEYSAAMPPSGPIYGQKVVVVGYEDLYDDVHAYPIIRANEVIKNERAMIRYSISISTDVMGFDPSIIDRDSIPYKESYIDPTSADVHRLGRSIARRTTDPYSQIMEAYAEVKGMGYRFHTDPYPTAHSLTMSNGSDCDGLSTLLIALLRSDQLQIPAWFEAGVVFGRDGVGLHHAWCVCLIDGGLIYLDPAREIIGSDLACGDTILKTFSQVTVNADHSLGWQPIMNYYRPWLVQPSPGASYTLLPEIYTIADFSNNPASSSGIGSSNVDVGDHPLYPVTVLTAVTAILLWYGVAVIISRSRMNK